MPGMMFNVVKKPKDLKPNPFNVDIYGTEDVDEELLISIKEKGLLEPIVIKDDGTIISGHRRWLALKKLGIDANCRTITFDNELDEKECLIEFNRQRKKTATQMMKESDTLEVIVKERARINQISKLKQFNENPTYDAAVPLNSAERVEEVIKEPTKKEANESRTIIAEKIGMKRDTYTKTKEIWDKAKQGDEVAKETFKKLDAGEITTHAAYSIVKIGEKAKEGNKKAETLLKKVNKGVITPNKAIKELKREEKKEEEIKKIMSSIDTELPGNIELIEGDFREEYKKIEAESIDFIITDPPYPKEFLPLYEDLAECAEHVLKPGGSMFVMVGQSYIPEIINMMIKHVNYHWILSYLTPGGQSAQLWKKKVNTFWKPVLWFTKGEYVGKWTGDVIKSENNDNDKRFHKWGQSESGMYDLMRRFLKPKDKVLDPFMGGGTTGIICKSLKCDFIGIEKDKEILEIANARFRGNDDSV